jgi:hypothetical protein
MFFVDFQLTMWVRTLACQNCLVGSQRCQVRASNLL